MPVVWVQHVADHLPRGSDAWEIAPELLPDETEPHIEKHYGDSFEDTELEDVLSDLAVGRLLVVGAQTDACIRSTIHGALARGYDTTLVSDAHTTKDLSEWGAPPPDQVISHTNLYWTHQEAPGLDRRHGRNQGCGLQQRRAAEAGRDRPAEVRGSPSVAGGGPRHDGWRP